MLTVVVLADIKGDSVVGTLLLLYITLKSLSKVIVQLLNAHQLLSPEQREMNHPYPGRSSENLVNQDLNR